MGLFSTVGNIALSILGGIAGQASGNLDRQSRRSGLSEEQRQKFKDASSNARNVADQLKKARENRTGDE
jgi:hypothetical protein